MLLILTFKESWISSSFLDFILLLDPDSAGSSRSCSLADDRLLIIILLKSVDFARCPLHKGTLLIISSFQKYSYSILNFYHLVHQNQFQNLQSSSAIEYFVSYQSKNLILWIYWLDPNLSICQNPTFNLSLLIHF